MNELRQLIENGDVSVVRDEALHVYASTDVLSGNGYVGAELADDDPTYREIAQLLEDGHLEIGDDGVVVIVDGETVYTQYLIEPENGCRGCSGTCCTGVGSYPCTCD